MCVSGVGEAQNSVNLQAVTLSLLERPTEPVFMPKGEKGVILDVPQNYLVNIHFLLSTQKIMF